MIRHLGEEADAGSFPAYLRVPEYQRFQRVLVVIATVTVTVLGIEGLGEFDVRRCDAKRVGGKAVHEVELIESLLTMVFAVEVFVYQ